MERYKPESMKTEEEIKNDRIKEEIDQYVTDSKGNKKKIELVGFEEIIKKFEDVTNAKDISL